MNFCNLVVDFQLLGLRFGFEKKVVLEVVVVVVVVGEFVLEEGIDGGGEISDELWKLLVLVLEYIGQKLVVYFEIYNLVEIVFDLGCWFLVCFFLGDWYILEIKVIV